jgi:hypothetical protein
MIAIAFGITLSFAGASLVGISTSGSEKVTKADTIFFFLGVALLITSIMVARFG